MASHHTQHFQNDQGAPQIEIGVKTFMCTGASKFFDHPHIFLNMGHDSEKRCPYCSTLYIYKSTLKEDETIPPGCLYTFS